MTKLFSNRNVNISSRHGFTIVELLIVIVVIGILAAITIVAYSSLQGRAQSAKIQSDLSLLEKSIYAARIGSGDIALQYVTGSNGTVNDCVWSGESNDLANRSAVSSCWTRYDTSLRLISEASGIDVRGLKDPWGRPYLMDENEGEGATTCGNSQDKIGSFPKPRVRGSWAADNQINIAYIIPGC